MRKIDCDKFEALMLSAARGTLVKSECNSYGDDCRCSQSTLEIDTTSDAYTAFEMKLDELLSLVDEGPKDGCCGMDAAPHCWSTIELPYIWGVGFDEKTGKCLASESKLRVFPPIEEHYEVDFDYTQVAQFKALPKELTEEMEQIRKEYAARDVGNYYDKFCSLVYCYAE